MYRNSLFKTIIIFSLIIFQSLIVQADSNEVSGLPKVFVADPELAETFKKSGDFTSGLLSSQLAGAVTELKGFESVTKNDIKAVLEKTSIDQTVGCEDFSCSTDMAKMAKADLLLHSELGKIGSSIILNGSLINVQEGRVANRHSLTFRSNEMLNNALTVMVKRLFGQKAELKPLHAIAMRAKKESKTDTKVDEVEAEKVEMEAKPVEMETEKVEYGRILVLLGKHPEQLIDKGGKAALERRVAQKLTEIEGLEVIAREEIQDLLQKQAEVQMLSDGDPDALSKVAKSLDAQFVTILNIGKVGESILVSGSLLDAKEAAAAGRSSLLLPDSTQITEAAEVVALGLFGKNIKLPPAKHKPNRFELSMDRLALFINDSYAPYKNNALSSIAVLPFTDQSFEAKERKIGSECASFLARLIKQQYGLNTSDPQKLGALGDVKDLSGVDNMKQDELNEISRFLGVNVLATGNVTDIGDDFLVRVKFIDTAKNKHLGDTHVFIPMGKRGTLVKKAFAARTRADALFRTIVPGWAQFYNGPKHYTKGTLIFSGTTLSIISAVSMMMLANSAQQEKLKWDRGGTEYINNGCTPTSPICENKTKSLNKDTDKYNMLSIGSVALTVAFYVYSFADAWVYAEDYSDYAYGE